MRPNPLRSAALPVLVTAGLLLLVLAIMLATTTRSLTRIDPLREHLAVMQRLHEEILSMQYVILRGLDASDPIQRVGPADLARSVERLAREPGLLSPDGRRRAEQARALLDNPAIPPGLALHKGITLLHEALAAENRAHAILLQGIHDQARLEMQLAAASMIAIPLAAVFVLYLLRRRFLLPLSNLNILLSRLGDGNFVPARVEDVDPVLESLIANYNHMVARLAQLEAQQTAHRQGLEAEVRAATRELLAHNRSLAQAEKLATVGEMAAGVAHELRNPLAGIDLALANLRQELDQSDAGERIDLIRAELKRLGGLLNDLLDQARLTPEATRPVAVAGAVGEVLALARYQIPEQIGFAIDIPTDLVCQLPEARLRQAVLNLILNAAQAMPGAGSISVRVRRTERGLELVVEDDGPGFPEAMLREGVQPFRTGRQSGSGLGLATVRRLALDLDGRLVLENLPERGARVTLLLPCATIMENAS